MAFTLEIDITDKAKMRLDLLREAMGADDYVPVFESALTIFEYLIDRSQNAQKIYEYDRSGNLVELELFERK